DPGDGSALPPHRHRLPEPREERDGVTGSRCHGAFSHSRPYQRDREFNPDFIQSKSTAAAGLCSWCLNIVRFYEVYCEVEPKRLALEE
ncbi:DYH17 protein, partial [Syrrhaptes paradoxus]|nr:DYH17 protein [Syrrhaptes paradoxus]